MSNRYLMPCPVCRAPLSVGLTQAGETLVCSCGAPVVVPTLRELRSLPSASPTETPLARQNQWSSQRGLAFVLGVLVLAGAGLLAWRIAPQRNAVDIQKPDFPELQVDLERLTPVEAWDAWVHFRDQTLDYRATPKYIENRVKYAELSYYLYAAAAAGLTGLGLVLGSIFWPSRR